MKIFISGPMAGYKDFNNKAFYDAEAELTSKGWSVFNPAWIKVDSTWDRNNLLPIDIAAVAQCDAIFMLTGWEQSAGARAEYEFAVSCGKTVIYQSTLNASSPKIIITDAYDTSNTDHSPIDSEVADECAKSVHVDDVTLTETCTITPMVDGSKCVKMFGHEYIYHENGDLVSADTHVHGENTGKLPKLVRVDNKEEETNNGSVK